LTIKKPGKLKMPEQLNLPGLIILVNFSTY